MDATLDRPHVLGRVVTTFTLRPHLTRVLGILLAALILDATIAYIAPAVRSAPGEVRRDFNAVYLLVWSLANGVNFNLPLPELGNRFGVDGFARGWPFPTPHPPTMGLVLLPLAALPYPTASTLWAIMSSASLVIAVAGCARAVGWHASPLTIGAVAASLTVWEAARSELWHGQVMLAMLALLSGCWLAYRLERPTLAGVLLGVALLLKPIAWPVLAFLLARRQWRAAIATFAVLGCGYGIVAAIAGPWSVVTYFTVSLPTAEALVRQRSNSLAPASIGWRLFEGATVWLDEYPGDLPPVVAWPPGARVLSTMVILAVLLAAWLSLRRRPVPDALPAVIAYSVLASPIVWKHYLVLIVPLVATIVSRLAAAGWPSSAVNRVMLPICGLLVPEVFYKLFAAIVSLVIPKTLAWLLVLSPAVALIWLLAAAEGTDPQEIANTADA